MKEVVRAWRRLSVSGDAMRCGAIIICEEWNDEAPDWMLLGVSGGFWKQASAFLDGQSELTSNPRNCQESVIRGSTQADPGFLWGRTRHCGFIVLFFQ